MKRVLPIGCSDALLSVTADCFIYKNINRRDELVKINEKGIKKIEIHLVYSVYIFLNFNRVVEQDDEWKREETMKFRAHQIHHHNKFSNTQHSATHQL